MVLVLRRPLANSILSIDVELSIFVVARGRSTVHNPVRVSLGPVSTVWPVLFLMVTFSLVKVAVQSLSHSCPMDRRFPVLRSLNTRAAFAGVGTFGIASFVCVVEMMDCPLGHPTDSGLVSVIIMFLSVMRYVPLAPESGWAVMVVGWATRLLC